MVFLFPPLKPPSPQISVAKVLIVCFCHDKRLRNFLARLFFTISIVVLIFVFSFKMAVFFLFLRNVLLPIEILKIKILEHSDPPSQHFFVHKAFSHSFSCRGKVVLCHLAEWHTAYVFYMDKIHYQIDGDTKACLLRVIDRNRRVKNGYACTIEPNHREVFCNLDFKKNSVKNFSNNSMNLPTETVRLVSFAGGEKVVLTLKLQNFSN